VHSELEGQRSYGSEQLKEKGKNFVWKVEVQLKLLPEADLRVADISGPYMRCGASNSMSRLRVHIYTMSQLVIEAHAFLLSNNHSGNSLSDNHSLEGFDLCAITSFDSPPSHLIAHHHL
jgi:hypothetical protein